jgi:hypothetical protein
MLKKRKEAMLTYEDEVIEWKRAMRLWITNNGANRVERVTRAELVECNSGKGWHSSREAGFDMGAFFAGAPRPPVFPSNDRISRVRNTLRHLAITGQSTIVVGTEELNRMFGEDED